MSDALRVECVACGSSFVLDDNTLARRDWPGNPGGWEVGITCPVCVAFTLSYRMTPELEAQRVALEEARTAYQKRKGNRLWVQLQRKQKAYQKAFDAVQGKGSGEANEQ